MNATPREKIEALRRLTARGAGPEEVEASLDELDAACRSLEWEAVRFRELLDLAPASIYEFDLTTGRFAWVNRTICDRTGYSAEDLLAMNPLDMLTEESQVLMMERHRRIAAGEAVEPEAVYELKTRNGPNLRVLLTSNLIHDQGLPVRAVVVGLEISSRTAGGGGA
ncbi:MAG: PAS domain S-box protein [Proteobacteria bacterium]|nr:PAS domain S-box protein [Pseudomonadota bacterium]